MLLRSGLTSSIMAMNLCHRWCCSSDRWAKEVEDAPAAVGARRRRPGRQHPGDRAGLRRHPAGAGRQDAQAHRRRNRSSDGAAAATAVRRPGAHHQRRRHRHRIAGRRVQLGGVVHHAAPRPDRGAARPDVRRSVPGAAPRRRLRRQRQRDVAAVPDPAFPRHLQPGLAGDLAGSLARGGISGRRSRRSGAGRQRWRAVKAG